ncbi:MAG: hypothetical protein IH964_04250 [Candidatus Dadabacteria bacterium]|nr:hypothetical protein [Candidatus Dadabacteria bacterium]
MTFSHELSNFLVTLSGYGGNKIRYKIILLAFGLVCGAVFLNGNMLWAANSDKCELVDNGNFLILNRQSYALCATADCFSFNQLAYCKCDVLRGDSISEPFDYGINQNICTLNQDGKRNGYRASTFSYPDDVAFPNGKKAFYTCPGKDNKSQFIDDGHPARGTYSQCDGGICFTSTRRSSFPGFAGRLRKKEIICSCPFSTICENSSESPNGYQSSGPYSPEDIDNGDEGGCSVEACEMCNAGALTEFDCDLPNPITQIGNGEHIPVGSPAGIPVILACLLLDNNVPDSNSCVCQCKSVDADGICKEWAVFDESPLQALCPPQ